MVSGLYPPELKSVNLDVDWIYRKIGMNFLRVLQRLLESLWKIFVKSLDDIQNTIVRQTKVLSAPNGVMARTWSTSTGTSWMLAILAILLAILFFS